MLDLINCYSYMLYRARSTAKNLTLLPLNLYVLKNLIHNSQGSLKVEYVKKYLYHENSPTYRQILILNKLNIINIPDEVQIQITLLRRAEILQWDLILINQ